MLKQGNKIVRGGSFDFDRWVARCVYRLKFNSDYRFSGWGFRIVRKVVHNVRSK